MAAKPRSRAGMDAEAVARLMAAQEVEDETPAPEAAPVPQLAELAEIPPPPAIEPEASPEPALPLEISPEPQWATETSIELEPEPVAVSPAEPEPRAETGEIELPEASEFDPGKLDGRTLRRTGREPFATRIKPEAHAALKRIAFARRITMAEALELAVAAYEKRLKPEIRKPAA